ncbi:MAG TPA: hydrogenase maturation protease [Gaiellales bacterium]
MTRTIEKQILVAGIGNSWLRDDGFGGEVARRLEQRELPPGVTVVDFGTGGLDLAYEVMRGYDALLLVDASRQGEPPGTLYVMEADEADVATGIADGDTIDPHAMDPASVLRFVKAVGGWPGQVLVIACEPAEVEEVGFGLSPEISGAVDQAVDLVLSTIAGLRGDAPLEVG